MTSTGKKSSYPCPPQSLNPSGANNLKYDAQITTKGLKDVELVLKREGGGSLDGRRGEPIGGSGGGQSDIYGKVDRG